MSACFAKWMPDASYYQLSPDAAEGYFEGPGGIIGEAAKALLHEHKDVRLSLAEGFGRIRRVAAFDDAGRIMVVVTVEKRT